MKYITTKAMISLIALTIPLTSIDAGADDNSNPWIWMTGRWEIVDDGVYQGEVMWTKIENADALLGHYVWPDSSYSTEVAGWQSSRGVIVSTAYGSDGSFWNIEAQNVTADRIQGRMWNPVFEGMFQVTKESNDRMKRVFTGFDQDGNVKTVTGYFNRIE